MSGNTYDLYRCEFESFQESKEVSSGTAFFINSQGHLLTNHHVIDGCVQSKINYLKKESDVELISSDKNLDLALLKADVEPKSFISFSKNKLKKRDLITAAGYPLGIELSDDLKINDGKVSALKGLENNSNHIMHTININPGNSGGPIVNQKGELVAVAVSGMSKDITEGLNFGIKSTAVENFLMSNKINPTFRSVKLSTNSDKVNQLLEESTVYTFCKLKN
jgi:S1-C subfamily serine protease